MNMNIIAQTKYALQLARQYHRGQVRAVEPQLGLDYYDSHIVPDQAQCARCNARMCIPACPAELWSLSEETGAMVVEHAGCLECGTCMLVCPHDAVTWSVPDGTFGVQFRCG